MTAPLKRVIWRYGLRHLTHPRPFTVAVSAHAARPVNESPGDFRSLEPQLQRSLIEEIVHE